nr:Nif3-like dinuclear metal center hexameric protein [Gorillibacterium timonense]
MLADSETGETTVDELNPGGIDTEASGIVTAFTASHFVIEQALAFGANLVISHEGIYYSHRGDQEWLKKDPVYLDKERLIGESGIAIYRFHDGIHRYKPDGIMQGLLRELKWESYVTEQQPTAAVLELPEMELAAIAAYLKRQLKLSYVRVAGDFSLLCRKVGVLAGYRGSGELVIPLLQDKDLDLIIAGEGPEWEAPEYIKDAVHQGRGKALIMLGHAESEAPGMKVLAEQLAARYPDIPVHYVQDRPIYQIV